MVKTLFANVALPVTPTVPISPSDQFTGNGVTVKLVPLLFTPPTLTTTFPVVAPVGTATEILVFDQQEPQGVAAVPLNFTVLVPWLAPKLVPVMVTEIPIGPEVIERLEMVGVALVAVLQTSPTRTVIAHFRKRFDLSEIIGVASGT
jgi:hypothetical protein